MIDSHVHLNDEGLYPEVDEIIHRALDKGVKAFLCVGYDLESSIKAVELANKYQEVYAAVGYQPENIIDVDIKVLDQIKELAKSNKKVIAIGEIGLDYHWFKKEEKGDLQKEWLIKQIEIANELNLPVSIHCREAIQDLFDLLKEHPVNSKGVLHCYSGSVEMLKEFAKLGYYFGFGGTSTFKNAKTPKECATLCPIDRLLLETDAPYLAPHPYRGKRNEPAYIPLILENIASLKNMSKDDLEKSTDKNFENLFHVEL